MTDLEFLESLFVKYGTDKGIWGYGPHYTAVMGPKRFDVRNVLEIGICGYRDLPNNVVGASLFVWREFFPNAEIYGIDNDGRFIFNDQERIHTALLNAYDVNAFNDQLTKWGVKFDFIVDDAVHDPGPQIILMGAAAPWLVPGGHFFMEDVGPEKMPDRSLQRGLYDHIKGYSSLTHFPTPKNEVLVMGVK